MKRLTAGLLALMLLSLLSGCGKKEQWSVDNFFLSDDGTTYSVSYRHDDGTQELIAEMGSYPQPLTIVSGKLYFVRGGSMVAVDLKDPTQRQTITEPGAVRPVHWLDRPGGRVLPPDHRHGEMLPGGSGPVVQQPDDHSPGAPAHGL